jgi:2-keto-3-deoxy-L-rhamnonate aldolase RhmA
MPLPASGASLTTLLHGLWRIVPSPMLTELLAQSGLDFQILDCEHGAYDYATLLPDILACERHGCAPFVRVSGTDKVEVQRCLDLGAQGIVFPQLTDPAQFAAAGAMMDYAPAGTRGFNPFVRASRYGAAVIAGATPPGGGSGRPWFIPIVETLAAAEQIDAIVRLDRIDLVYIGVYDLSAQLGCPGQMDAPALTAVVARVLAACARARKPAGMMSLSDVAARRLADQGVTALVHGVESHTIKQAMSAIVQPLRGLRPNPKDGHAG